MDQKKLNDFVRFVRQGISLGNNPLSLLQMVDEDYRDAVHELLKKETVDVQPAPGGIVSRTRPAWDSEFDSSQGPLWLQLREFLFETRNRTPPEVSALDKASDKVLYLLGNPKEQGERLDKVRGLVIGYVQSGKTANYTALAAKAFDSGFKLVIVLAGIHNALRRQTQMRLDDELGLLTSSPERPTASKTGPIGPDAISLATGEDLLNGDFKYSNIASNVLANGRFLFVTKKNAAVLSKLIKWIGSSGKYVPTLIIDDEADQATINTRGSVTKAEYETFEGDNPEDLDVDPTRINELIRELLGKFTNVSYVGYTATPYANVFITHNATHSKLEDDLYPKDFIVSLPKPPNYMGPEEFFGSELSGDTDEESSISSRVLNIVSANEVDDLANLGPGHSGSQHMLPEKLKEAVRSFLLATAAKRTFEKQISPTSMLIHASHLNEVQNNIAQHVQLYVDQIRDNWRYFKTEFQNEWESDWSNFRDQMAGDKYQYSFEEIEPAMSQLLGKYSPLPVLLLNYSSDDELDYERNPNLTAIVVGGNKLSRGLTLEGLLVSYFVRRAAAPKADTLTQMGRFFGYRREIIDLTRIYTTDELRTMFVEVSLVESSLRREIAYYEKMNKTPLEFAPRVLRRAALMPTAKNRMLGATAVGVTYSGDLVQTTSFPSSKEKPKDRNSSSKSKNEVNLERTSAFLATLESKYSTPVEFGAELKKPQGMLTRTSAKWTGVSHQELIDFIGQFHAVDGATRFVPSNLASYISSLSNPKQGESELTSWTVAVLGRKEDTTLGTESFGTKYTFGRIERSVVFGSDSSVGVLVNPLDPSKKSGDELIDFSDEDFTKLEELKASNQEMSYAAAIRATRSPSKGLLTIYPISPASRGKVTSNPNPGKRWDKSLGEVLDYSSETAPTIVGLAISFPVSESDLSFTELWVGSVGLNNA